LRTDIRERIFKEYQHFKNGCRWAKEPTVLYLGRSEVQRLAAAVAGTDDNQEFMAPRSTYKGMCLFCVSTKKNHLELK